MSEIAISRLSAKHQTTIPEKVRAALDLQAGDNVAFEIEDDRVLLRKAAPLDVEYLKALEGTLGTEWLSAADEEAYGDL